eukprot:gnl/Chilomastix_caulleri/5810.p1 GENE.gnl/Chilomastix_caulleri/5810~~gnl/Chilomastix_caulleri/5810.p1  ORF type:complete len:51 (+),score=6.13 gnl/Chilomastix_caulleri/5810:82-234(+)
MGLRRSNESHWQRLPGPSTPIEAIAALGVVFDRESILISAEEVYGSNKAR